MNKNEEVISKVYDIITNIYRRKFDISKLFYLVNKHDIKKLLEYIKEELKYIKSLPEKVDPDNKNNIAIYYLLFDNVKEPSELKHFYSKGDYPDWDVDVEPSGRELLKNYLKTKYDILEVGTFHRMGAKGAIQDACRYYDIPAREYMKITTSIKNDIHNPEHNTLEYLEENNLYVKELFKKYQKVKDLSYYLNNRIRQLGTHACAILITNLDLNKNLPIAKTSNNLVVAVPESSINKYLNQLGFYKFDILSLDALRIIKETLDLAGKNINDALNDYNENDSKLYRYVNALKLHGVFMFNTPLSQRIIKLIKPNKFNDMVAINALARPLALKKKYEVEYANRKRGKFSGFNLYKIKNILSSRTNELLEKSYYLPIYQEQVQYVVADLCNISFAETNKLRKLISKIESKRTDDDRRIIESYRQKILANKNIDNPEQVWNEIVGGLEYGFNIAHATAYTDLSMKQLHIKIKYPTEFYISVLNNEDNNLYVNKPNHFIEIIREAESLGIEFKYPDINLSDFKSKKIGDKKILLGLGLIKGFGISNFKKLEKNRPYANIIDFASRTKFNKNMVLSFVYAGCFDSIHSREECYKLLGEKYSKERELEDEFNSLCFILKKRFYKNIIFLRSKNKVSSSKYRYICNDTNKEVFVYSKKDLPEGFAKDNLEL